MKRFITVQHLFLLVIIFVVNLNAQWEVVEQSATSDTLNSVFMFSSTAWAVGEEGTIIKSTDAGSTWTSLNSGTSEDLEDVYFHNENEGVVVGKGGIFQTQDGGQTWTQVEVENSGFSKAVSFVNENRGVVTDISGDIFLTSDGGSSWAQTEEGIPTFDIVTDIKFVSDSIAYAVGSSSGNIFKSTDGCESWVQLTSDISESFRAVSFYDENNGIAFGIKSYLTSDGGQNWSELENVNSFFFLALDGQFISSQLCFTVGLSGKIYKSTDVGNTWTEQESGTDKILTGVYFSDENNGIAVGYDGTIVITSNGGVTSVSSESKIPVKFNLAQNYPNPFNPSTTISYSIPKTANVSLKVYDALGKEVAQLINKEKAAGTYEVQFDASNLSSGIYFYTLKTNSFLNTKKMILIK